jgi:hypothetical protein
LGFDQPVLSPVEGPVLSIATVSGSTDLTTGFDRPVLTFVEGLRTNGWDVEAILRYFLTGTQE